MKTSKSDAEEAPKTDMAMGQNPVPSVNISIPAKIGSKMALTPKWDPIGFDPQPYSFLPKRGAISHGNVREIPAPSSSMVPEGSSSPALVAGSWQTGTSIAWLLLTPLQKA